jgi:hypothetical protein
VAILKTEQEIKKQLETIEKVMLEKGPFREWENIAMKSTKQALEWVLEKSEKVISF